MGDYIVSALAFNDTVRAFCADTTETVREARRLHSLAPVTSSALGRTLTAAAMMSKQLKGAKESITIQIKGGGPAGAIVAVSNSNSEVRGYIGNPEVYLPLTESGKLDVAGAIGKDGYLNIIKDIGLREPYVGYVPLQTGEIGEDIAYYYAFSEQVPSVVSLGVLVDRDESILYAGGFILQLMPGAEEDTIQKLEDSISQLAPVTSLMASGNKPEEILEMIFLGNGMRIIDKSPVSYVCNCSRERMERNIISMGRKEIQEMIDEQHGAEAQCHFCNKRYGFSETELKKLLAEAEK